MNIKSLEARAKNLMAIRKERGLSLTETLLVLGVIALIAVIAYLGYNAATSSVKTGGEAQALVQLTSNITKTFASSADYAGVTAQSVIEAGLVPKQFKVKGTGASRTIQNAYGGTIVPSTQSVPSANTSKFQLVYDSVPSESCVELAQAVGNAAQEIYISASGTAAAAADAVKTAALPAFNTATAISKCTGDAPKQITVIGT